MGASFSMMPPCWVRGFGLVWRLTRLTPSTIDLVVVEKNRFTRPCLPLYLPLITTTVSPRCNAVHQSTSGASEMIFMNFLARSSRATGPKMRVPIGSSWALMSTALFASNLM